MQEKEMTVQETVRVEILAEVLTIRPCGSHLDVNKK